MSRTPTERVRIGLSRVLVAGITALVLTSVSAWQDHAMGIGLFCAGCILIGIGAIGRIWASLYVAGRKTTSLVTTGPYSLCRNPLYLFSLIGGCGVAMTTETFTVPALVAVMFGLYYPWVIRCEEQRLRDRHGAAFDAYCGTTPSFWPRFTNLREEATCTVNAIVFRRNITDVLWFFWLVGLVEVVERLHATGTLPSYFTLR